MNKTDAYKKALATIQFDKWFQENIESRLRSYVQNDYTKRVQNFVNHVHGSFMYQMFSFFSSNCKSSDFRKLLSHYKGNMKKSRLLYNYIRSKMK